MSEVWRQTQSKRKTTQDKNTKLNRSQLLSCFLRLDLSGNVSVKHCAGHGSRSLAWSLVICLDMPG
ncbi:hypothetical protein FOXYSP1_04967 [Fusarium oxysporum f. sp. phaseoli]